MGLPIGSGVNRNIPPAFGASGLGEGAEGGSMQTRCPGGLLRPAGSSFPTPISPACPHRDHPACHLTARAEIAQQRRLGFRDWNCRRSLASTLAASELSESLAQQRGSMSVTPNPR